MSRYSKHLKAVSLLLVLTFLGSELAHAAPFEGASAFLSKSPLDQISQDPTRFEAPVNFSTLKEIHQGQKSTFIIHIQDAHSNLSGQENLSKTLDEIMTKYGVSLVLVEGGDVDGTLTPLKKIASPEITKQVAKSLLIEGKIAGEEYLNLTSDHPMKIMGIEDMDLYLKSVRSYADLADQRQAILNYLKKIQSSVDVLKEKLYPKELLEYERAVSSPNALVGDQARPDSRLRGNDVKGLISLAELKQIDFSQFPAVQALKVLQEKEKSINFNLANLEETALIEELQKQGSFEDIKSYLAKADQMRDQMASQFAYFQNLFEISKEKNISLNKYPNLLQYGEYLKNYSSLDTEELLKELQEVEDKVYVSYLPTTDQRLIRSIDRYLGLLNTAYHIQMSTDDFNFFKLNEPDFSTASYLAFLNRKLVDLGCFSDLVPYQDTLEKGKKSLEAFYESVSQRDFAFINNAKRILENQNQKVAVLISGGYHTPHLKKLFKDEGYSFAILSPHVTQETDQNKYEKLLLSTIKKETKTIELTQGRESEEKSLQKDGVRVEEVGEPARIMDVIGPLAAAAGRPLGDPIIIDAKALFGQKILQSKKPIELRQKAGARLAYFSQPYDIEPDPMSERRIGGSLEAQLPADTAPNVYYKNENGIFIVDQETLSYGDLYFRVNTVKEEALGRTAKAPQAEGPLAAKVRPETKVTSPRHLLSIFSPSEMKWENLDLIPLEADNMVSIRRGAVPLQRLELRNDLLRRYQMKQNDLLAKLRLKKPFEISRLYVDPNDDGTGQERIYLDLENGKPYPQGNLDWRIFISFTDPDTQRETTVLLPRDFTSDGVSRRYRADVPQEVARAEGFRGESRRIAVEIKKETYDDHVDDSRQPMRGLKHRTKEGRYYFLYPDGNQKDAIGLSRMNDYQYRAYDFGSKNPIDIHKNNETPANPSLRPSLSVNEHSVFSSAGFIQGSDISSEMEKIIEKGGEIFPLERARQLIPVEENQPFEVSIGGGKDTKIFKIAPDPQRENLSVFYEWNQGADKGRGAWQNPQVVIHGFDVPIHGMSLSMAESYLLTIAEKGFEVVPYVGNLKIRVIPRDEAEKRGLMGARLAKDKESSAHAQDFIRRVIEPVSGALPGSVDVSVTQDADGASILAISHVEKFNDHSLNLSYRIEFKGKNISINPVIPSLTETNVIEMPPKDWNEADIQAAQNAWRRVTIADPLLNRRFASEEITLTPYQEAGLPKIMESLNQKGHALVVMATATGKTVVAFQVMDQLIHQIKGRGEEPGAVLFVVNNRIILREAEEKLHQTFKDEYKSSHIYEGEKDYSGDVIFATPASLMSGNRLEELLKTRKISAVIFDEVHHVPASQNRLIFRRIQEESLAKKQSTAFLGFTATETRPDRISVIAFFGREIAYEYPIVQGWEEGFLTPMRYLSGDGDINPGNRGPILFGDPLYEHYLAQRYADSRFPHLLELYRQRSENLIDKRTLVLAPTIERANALAEYFRRQGVAAITLTSEQRQDPLWFDHHYEAWKTGRWPKDSPYAAEPVPQVVMAVDIFREGIDAPAINLLLLWADTNSAIRYMQSLGRGLRLYPFKTHLTVVDTVGLFRKVHLLRYLGGLFVERESGNGIKVAGEEGRAIGPETEESMTGRGIEFGRDVTQVVQTYFNQLVEHLQYRYGAYPLIPANEMPRLDIFLAKRMGFSSAEELYDYILGFSREMVSGASPEAIQAFHDRCLPAFYHSAWTPELLGTTPKEIETDYVTIVVFNRFSDLFSRLNSDMTEQYMYKIFPEFNPDREKIIKNRAQNLKALRLQVFGASHQQMSAIMRKELLAEDRANQLDKDVLLELRSEELSIDRGQKQDTGMAIFSAEGKLRANDAKEEEAVLGQDYMRTSASVWQNLVIKSYLSLSVLSGKLTAKDFGLPVEDFARLLTSLGLAQGEKGTRSFFSLLKKDVEAYVKAVSTGEAEAVSLTGKKLNELISKEGNLAVFDPQNVTKGRMETLLDASARIDACLGMLGQNTSEQDRDIRRNFDAILQTAGIRWQVKPAELPGVRIVAQREVSLNDFTISVFSENNQYRQAIARPSFKISVRKDYLQRAHAYLTDEEESGLEALYSQLDEGGRRILIDAIIDELVTLRHIYDDELVLIIPQDPNGVKFFSALFERVLETTDWDVLGQLTNVIYAAKKEALGFSYDSTRRSRLSFLTADKISLLKGFYKFKDMSAVDKIAYIYVSIYEHWHVLLPQWQTISRKLDHFLPSPALEPAFNHLKQQVAQQMAKDVTGPARVAALKAIFEILEANHPDKPLTEDQVRLAALYQIISFNLWVSSGLRTKGEIMVVLREFRSLKLELEKQGKAMPSDIAEEVQAFIQSALGSYLTIQGFSHEMENEAKALADKLKQSTAEALVAKEADLTEPGSEDKKAAKEKEPMVQVAKPPFYNEDGELLFFVSGKKKKTVHIDPNCPLNDLNTQQIYTRDQAKAYLRGFTLCKGCKTPPVAQWEVVEGEYRTKYGGKTGGHVYKQEGARLASLLVINQATTGFPQFVFDKKAFESSLVVSAAPYVGSGIVPVQINSDGFIGLSSIPIPTANGSFSVRLMNPLESEKVYLNQVFTKEEIQQAAARLAAVHTAAIKPAPAQNIDLQVAAALDIYHDKEQITRQLLRRVVTGLTETTHLILYLSVSGQDQTEMLKELKEIEAELTELNENRGKDSPQLFIYPRFIDENGKEVAVSGFTPKTAPKGTKSSVSGILKESLLNLAMDKKGAYLPLESAYADKTGDVRAVPYKAGIRTAISAPLNEELAARMLENLVDPGTKIDSSKMKIIREPSSVKDISIATYQKEHLIVRALATLKEKLYEAYIALRETGKSA